MLKHTTCIHPTTLRLHNTHSHGLLGVHKQAVLNHPVVDAPRKEDADAGGTILPESTERAVYDLGWVVTGWPCTQSQSVQNTQ